MKNFPIYLFFASTLILGIFIYDDFGNHFDTGISTRNGVINAFYINEKLGFAFLSPEQLEEIKLNSGEPDKFMDLKDFKDRYYGSINELVLIAPAVILKKHNDTYYLYRIKHISNYVFFWFSSIAIFFIILIRNKNKYLALIGTAIYYLSPRIFAHGFYNSKDGMFMIFLVFAILFGTLLLYKNKYIWAILFSLFTAIYIDIRIPGIIFPVLFFFTYAVFVISNKKYKISYHYPIILSILIIPVFIVIFWPYLWDSPINNFFEAWKRMSKYPFYSYIKYFDNLVPTNDTPWHYIFVWIFFTTPILYTLGFLLSLYFLCKDFINSKIKMLKDINFVFDTLMVLLFFAPIIAVIVFNSTLYNGWRQLYFVYPPLILLSIGALYKTYIFIKNKSKKLSKFSVVFISLYLIYIMGEMIYLHPYQGIYYNFTVRKYAHANFELDYWGLTYREGIEHVVSLKPEGDIYLFQDEDNMINGFLRMQPIETRNRIKFTSKIEEADFLITTYYDFFYFKDNLKKKYHISPEQNIFSINRYGTDFLNIYKLDSNNSIDTVSDIPYLLFDKLDAIMAPK